MNAMTRRDLFGPVPDRSAHLDMPCLAVRAVMQAAAIKLRQMGADMEKRSTVALADMIEEASAGEMDASAEAGREAAALWRMGA